MIDSWTASNIHTKFRLQTVVPTLCNMNNALKHFNSSGEKQNPRLVNLPKDIESAYHLKQSNVFSKKFNKMMAKKP